MPQLDLSTFPSQIFWLAVFFVVLYLLMAKLAIPRIERVIDSAATASRAISTRRGG